MKKKHLLLPILILLLLTIPVLSQDEINVAPELILKEEDFTYEEYKSALKGLNNFLDECYKQEQGDNFWKIYDDKTKSVKLTIDWLILNIGIPNNLLRLEGYGLITQREIILLKLENAKLKDNKEEIANLEKALAEIQKKIEIFLSENMWVD